MDEPTGAAELLSAYEVAVALQSAVDELGLRLLVQEDEGVTRIYGPPGVFDPFVLTEVWTGDGIMRVECAVPVLVPEERLEEVLELCLGLNRQGRVAFALGRRGTPIACMTVRLTLGASQHAASLCRNSLKMNWQRCDAAEEHFRAVVEGAEAASVLKAIAEDPSLSDALPLMPRPGPAAGAVGAEWQGLLDHAPQLPDDAPVPDEYTESEFRAAAWALQLSLPNKGLFGNACGGPLLVHADAVVECYGCSEPALTGHLYGCVAFCDDGIHLGRGHRCDRCNGSA
jgi:hypothetical protein